MRRLADIMPNADGKTVDWIRAILGAMALVASVIAIVIGLAARSAFQSTGLAVQSAENAITKLEATMTAQISELRGSYNTIAGRIGIIERDAVMRNEAEVIRSRVSANERAVAVMTTKLDSLRDDTKEIKTLMTELSKRP